MMGKWRGVVFAGVLSLLTPVSAPIAEVVDTAVLDEIETYLNGITTLEARFMQVAPNGQQATGSLHLSRPGKLRMDYDPPSKILLIAPGDWRLIFYDGSIQQASTIPIGQTPLDVLLESELDLQQDTTVTELRKLDAGLAMTVVSNDAPDQGSVTLYFTETPIALSRWSVIDAQGLRTNVLLDDVRYGLSLDSELFRWRDPDIFGYPED